MSFTLEYGGIPLSNYAKIRDIRRSILPPREISLLTVPSRHGAYFTGSRYGVRKIEVDITIAQDDRMAMLDVMRFLAFCLDVEEPTDLVASDEPDKVNYAILSNDSEVDSLLGYGKATLTFLCPDPFAYSLDPKTITPVDGLFTFDNQGTTTAFPIFTTTFNSESSFISFTSPDGIVLIGNPWQPDQIRLPKTVKVLNDPMESTTGWVNAGTSIDGNNRVNTGSITVINGTRIGASSYGTGTTGQYHGPAVRKDLSQQLTDFTVKARVEFKSQDGSAKTLDGKQIGRLEIYLYDVNGFKIGKLSMRDNYENYEMNVPEIFVENTEVLTKEPKKPKGKKAKQKVYTTYVCKKGDTLEEVAKKFKMSLASLAKINNLATSHVLKKGEKLKVYDKTVTKKVYPESVGIYNDFYGDFTFTRSGDRFYVEVCRITEQGKKKYTIKNEFYDRGNKYSRNALSYIVIHFQQYESKPVVQAMRVTNLIVYKYNSTTTYDVPAIFEAGQTLEVDFNDSSVWLDDEPFMSQVDVGSKFFPLTEGTTEVKVNTDDVTATHEAEFTERYL